VLGRRTPRGLFDRLRGHVPHILWSVPCPVLSPLLPVPAA
jgi:hypothetical protein